MTRAMRQRVFPFLFTVAVTVGTINGASEARSQARTTCDTSARVTPIPNLNEASGLALSRRVPGRLWTHNDSGQPTLFALDNRGAVTGRLQLTGANVEDWEALAVGPCPAGSCLYVGDIGDNDGKRRRITVYRVAEPTTESTAAVTDALHATYPDRAQDAETLLVTPGGEIFIVTKGDTGAVGLYRFPKELKPGGTHVLERVGAGNGASKRSAADRITDGAVSPNGSWVVLRTNTQLQFHRAAALLAGDWGSAVTVDVKSVGEPQGEGVAIADDNAVFLAGEGGGKSRAGTFARMTCTLK